MPDSSTPPADAHNPFAKAAESLRPRQPLRHPRLREAAALLDDNRSGPAAKLLREFLKGHPRDATALHLLAETAIRQGRSEEAEALLAQCLELSPDSLAARFSYANTLLQLRKPEAALREAEVLLDREAGNPLFRRLKAIALELTGDYAASAVCWRGLVEDYPAERDCWLRYGHVLRALGLREDCVAAYRKAIEIDPAFGGAYWSLADLKRFRFSETDVAQMEAQLARSDLAAADRTRLHFSLGKAYADLGAFDKSFDHYAKANALHRVGLKHDPDVLTAYVARCKSLFTAEFFRARPDFGCDSRDPIFIVGTARSGSTLVEQILASHPKVEGTRELSDLAALARRLQLESPRAADYPAMLGKLDAAAATRLGEQYLERTRIHRNPDRPFFTDKMGANFAHLGLLQMILPKAKIVDVRRHPLACGWSIFAQLFPEGQNDAYRLADIGRLYRDYVDLMAHFDRALPGKIHRIFYEELVAGPEAEIRRLLDYLELPFERSCLQFHDTARTVTTASSEQVRSPIYRDALDQWRSYEVWLGPLKAALGPVLDAYPAVPSLD
jgi:tetratricopeptide (TPR) repeat protein